MSIDSITQNPVPSTWLLSKTVEHKSPVDNGQGLASTNDEALVSTSTAKSLLPASVVRDLLKPTSSTRDDVAKLSKLVVNGQMTEFQNKLEVIKAKNAMTTLVVAQKNALLAGVTAGLSSSLSGIEARASSDASAVLTPRAQNFIDLTRNAAAFNHTTQSANAESTNQYFASDAADIVSLFNNIANQRENSTSSSKEICNAVADAIASMGDSYLDAFQEAVEKFASFYADFSEALASLKKYMTAGDDGEIKFHHQGFCDEISDAIKKYEGDAGVLYNASSPEEAKAWAKEMGLDPDKCVDGTTVRIDLSSIKKMIKDFDVQNPTSNYSKYNSAQWAACQSTIDIVKDSVQTNMQSITQKYSNANSTFDNLVKILSSTISQLLDSDKSFLNI